MAESKGRTSNYEAMFLFSQATASDLGSVIEHINEIMSRADAEVIAMKKWDERRLAYEIDKQKRGTYILVYFSADPVRIAGIERDCNLSEMVMRSMVLRADHLTIDEMKAADGREELQTEIRMRDESEEEKETAKEAEKASEPAEASSS